MADLSTFKLYLLRKGYKPTTIKTRLQTIAFLLRVTSLAEVDAYFIHLLESQKKPKYLNSLVTSLRVYGSFIGNEKLTSYKFFKEGPTDKAIMSDKEIAAFLLLPGLGKGKMIWHYQKMNLFWKCLAYSGARCGEIAGLTTDCVDFGQGLFTVYGKMGRRVVPISPQLTDDLTEHIKTLRGKYLFPSVNTPRPIERATWGLEFRQRLLRLGIKRPNLTPYSLRHSFITRMLDEDINIFKVQKIVGHRRLETTANYTHLTTKDVVKTIKKDPLGRKELLYEERYKLLRERVREALSDLAQDTEEEKKMLQSLLNLS